MIETWTNVLSGSGRISGGCFRRSCQKGPCQCQEDGTDRPTENDFNGSPSG
ncbi:MAG: hypothetical protein LBH00_01925 [Planctomycetaceae bacterium]|nr:hypothetical protein [Planctomycetaceae bacterium]